MTISPSKLLFLSLASLGTCQTQSTESWPQDRTSANQGPNRYNFTYEINFDINSILEHQKLYQFNISLGTPPQSVPVTIDLTRSDILISNTTLIISDDGSGMEVDYYAYDPTKSSSARKDFEAYTFYNASLNISYSERSSEPVSPFELNVAYTQDNISINDVVFTKSVSFLSSEQYKYPPLSGSSPAWSFYHRIGFGLPEASAYNSIRQPGNTTANGISSRSVIDLLTDDDIIRSNSYSLWLDAPEDRTGHLLLGGIDTAAYHGPLTSLKTTVSSADGLWTTHFLTVNASFVSVTPTGQSAQTFTLPIGRAEFSTEDILVFPALTTKAIWDRLGAEYDVARSGLPPNASEEYQLALTTATVPCSYLSNSTTLDIGFEESDFLVSIPVSELTVRNRDYLTDGAEICVLRILASGLEDSWALLGVPALRNVYQVYDLENKVISVAHTNFSSTTRNIMPIPAQGGVAAMNLSSSNAAAGNSTGKPSLAVGLRGAMPGTVTIGALGIVVFLATLL